MPAEIHLTARPVRVTGLTKADLRNAVNVSAYKSLSMLLRALEVSGGGSVTARLLTGMQTDSFDGWVTLGTWSSASAVGQERMVFDDPLKYVVWEVSAMTATGFTFSIEGIGRES